MKFKSLRSNFDRNNEAEIVFQKWVLPGNKFLALTLWLHLDISNIQWWGHAANIVLRLNS